MPDELGGLTALKYISLAGNRFTAMGCGMSNLRSVQYLSLAANQLTSIPACLNNMTGIEQLSLNNNLLTVLPDLSALINLKQLDVGLNQLVYAPVSSTWAGTLRL